MSKKQVTAQPPACITGYEMYLSFVVILLEIVKFDLCLFLL